MARNILFNAVCPLLCGDIMNPSEFLHKQHFVTCAKEQGTHSNVFCYFTYLCSQFFVKLLLPWYFSYFFIVTLCCFRNNRFNINTWFIYTNCL